MTNGQTRQLTRVSSYDEDGIKQCKKLQSDLLLVVEFDAKSASDFKLMSRRPGWGLNLKKKSSLAIRLCIFSFGETL